MEGRPGCPPRTLWPSWGGSLFPIGEELGQGLPCSLLPLPDHSPSFPQHSPALNLISSEGTARCPSVSPLSTVYTTFQGPLQGIHPLSLVFTETPPCPFSRINTPPSEAEAWTGPSPPFLPWHPVSLTTGPFLPTNK